MNKLLNRVGLSGFIYFSLGLSISIAVADLPFESRLATRQDSLKIVAFGNSIKATRNTVDKVYAQRLPEFLVAQGLLCTVVNAGVKVVRQLSRKYKIGLVDNFEAFTRYNRLDNQSLDDLLLDGVHPNDQGHQLITEMLIEEIETLLVKLKTTLQ